VLDVPSSVCDDTIRQRTRGDEVTHKGAMRQLNVVRQHARTHHVHGHRSRVLSLPADESFLALPAGRIDARRTHRTPRHFAPVPRRRDGTDPQLACALPPTRNARRPRARVSECAGMAGSRGARCAGACRHAGDAVHLARRRGGGGGVRWRRVGERRGQGRACPCDCEQVSR
jgi:hypothetical protein